MAEQSFLSDNPQKALDQDSQEARRQLEKLYNDGTLAKDDFDQMKDQVEKSDELIERV